MLNELPNEVILTISNYLTFKEKFILITTCRHLLNLISNATLFSNINLFSKLEMEAYNEMVEKFFENFKSSRYSGSQVKVLSVYIDKIKEELFLQVPTLFPNIAKITVRDLFTSLSFRDHLDHNLLIPWINTLETFDLTYDLPEILPLLKTTTFPRLTELELGHLYDLEDRGKGFDIPYFLPYIKHAPSLKMLTLRICAINLEFLDEVHASCPHLESLSLSQASISIRNQTLSQQVVPAESLLSLKIEYASCFDTNGLFLDYIARKYRCLKHFSISFMAEYNTISFNECHHGANVLSHTDTVLERDPEYQASLRIYRSLKTEHKNTLAAYKGYGQTFLSNLTKSVKSMAIHVHMFDNLIQELVNSNIQPIKLDIMGRMNDIAQLQYITDIKGLRTMELHICLERQYYSYHTPSTNITKLTLHNLGKRITIQWVLLMFPSLEELCLEAPTSLIVTEDNVAECFPNLRKLTSKGRAVDQECLDYLKATSPNIQDIAMEIQYNRNIDIDISDWDLKRLKVEAYGSFKVKGLNCHITTPNSMKLIKYDPKEQSLAVAKKRSDPHDDKGCAWISIITTKEKHFTFNGFPISLLHDKITIDN